MTTNEWVLDVYDGEGDHVMVVRTPSERAEKAERELARAREIQQEAFRVSVDQARELVEARDEIRRLQAELRQARVEVEGS